MKVLLKQGIYVNNPCNGKGTCKKCDLLIKTKSRDEFVSLLSCETTVYEDIEIKLALKEGNYTGLSKGILPEFTIDRGLVGYGLAVDIGTTTVVVSLIDLGSDAELAQTSMINAQKHFGLDVLTRITYEYEHLDSGISDLKAAIVDSLNSMISELCEKTSISPFDIADISIAANCTMTHMLLGIDAKPIGRAPYKPNFTEAVSVLAKSIGLNLSDSAGLYCLPNVSSYIGSDIVAGVYVCELHKEKGSVLFIDIGTNGEIVLAHKGRLLSCSCAAGPALEGMNISCGMRAVDGAVEDIYIDRDKVKLTTIGGGNPLGLCGSGILSGISELLRTGIVKPSGVFIKKESISEDDYRYKYIGLNGQKREFVCPENPDIKITQNDVRQVQLAKGAILSGFVALLAKAGIGMDELDKVLIGGQFGAHLPPSILTGAVSLPSNAKRLAWMP